MPNASLLLSNNCLAINVHVFFLFWHKTRFSRICVILSTLKCICNKKLLAIHVLQFPWKVTVIILNINVQSSKEFDYELQKNFQQRKENANFSFFSKEKLQAYNSLRCSAPLLDAWNQKRSVQSKLHVCVFTNVPYFKSHN